MPHVCIVNGNQCTENILNGKEMRKILFHMAAFTLKIELPSTIIFNIT